MQESKTGITPALKQPKSEKRSSWEKTNFANMVRYVPSGVYFARMKVGGKLYRRSLKTDVASVAKLRLSDIEKDLRSRADTAAGVDAGKMTFGTALEIYLAHVEATARKPALKKYRQEITAMITRTWPEATARDIRRFSKKDCEAWADKWREYSAHRVNNAIGSLRKIFNVAIEAGAIYANPAAHLQKAKIRRKLKTLPEPSQFEALVTELENGGGRDSRNCADLVRFLAFGGFRKSEASKITWADCDFAKGQLRVVGDVDTATKNWEIRYVPMIPEMVALLERLRSARRDDPPEAAVMLVHECQKAIDRAAKTIGMARITHHNLRDLFATRCLETGVPVSTVAQWMGHKDGGALLLRTYSHLRNQHSADMAKKVSFTTQHPDNVVEFKKVGAA